MNPATYSLASCEYDKLIDWTCDECGKKKKGWTLPDGWIHAKSGDSTRVTCCWGCHNMI